MVVHFWLALFISSFSNFSLTKATLHLTVNHLKVNVSNDLVRFEFKADATASSVYIGEENIISEVSKSFYLDWTGTDGEIKLHPSSLTIVEESESLVHFYWTQNSSVTSDAFNIELHYILEDNVSGIYSYAKYANDKSENVTIGETRTIYRFNPSLFTEANNQMITGTLPTEMEIKHCTKVQDATYEFSNGTYYSKYDYAVYIRDTEFQGIYGNGYGAFVISPSRDYHGGGPLKQDLTVHEYSLVTNYFMSAHFGAGTFVAPSGWKHLYGPFLVYFPTGSNDEIINLVKAQTASEQKKWPYSFIQDEEYPLLRGFVSGTVSGQASATVTLWDSTHENFDVQQLGYLYRANTDSSGRYSITNVRPSSYRIVAYPTAGQGCENWSEDFIDIAAGESKVVDFTLNEPDNILWSIGEVNRKSNEFKYADQQRNYKWEFETPTNLTFTIGESDAANDWYYAQSQSGTWRIVYQDVYDGSSRTLRLPLAGASKAILTVVFNGENLQTFDLRSANDKSVYRSALQSGNFHSIVMTIEESKVVDGQNVIELIVEAGGVMYDAVSLQVQK